MAKKPPAKKTESLAKQFLALFAGIETAHGTHGMPVFKAEKNKWEIKSTAKTLEGPATVALWEEHLAGKKPLGVVPIMRDGVCVWASIDFDKYDINLLDIIQRVEALGLPLVPCRSKSGGLHLFIFFSEPQPAGAVQALLRDLSAQLGISGSEIFPKQAALLIERGDMGNWMVMPYYGDTFGSKIAEQVGLRKTGAELTAEEFLRAAEAAKVQDLQALAKLHPPARGSVSNKATAGTGGKKDKSTLPAQKPGADAFSDGPPCLQHLAKVGIEQGGQNNTLFMMGLYLKRAQPATWREDLEAYNHKYMKPPLPTDGMASTLRSLEKKDYEYTCSVEPMSSHCDARLCRRRKFGVSSSVDYPEISGLSVIDADPAIWFVDVDGDRLEMNTEDLLRYERFQRHCADKLHKVFMPLKHETWLKLVSAAMANCVTIEVPPEITLAARFRELLEDFCTNRQRGQRREDILSGRPWFDEEGSRHYFRMRDIAKFLERENLKNVTRGSIVQMVEKLGGGTVQLSFKGHNRWVWWVPGSVLQATPELEPPLRQEAVI